MSRRKIALIGAGQIGGTLALLASRLNLSEIIMFDIFADMAKGKALDLNQMNTLADCDTKIIAADSYAGIKGADVCIVTAGIPRKPGMSREDLLSTNFAAMKSVAQGIKDNCPEAFVIILTNPLDAMVYAFHRMSGLPKNRVVGMAGVLDSARFRSFVATELNVSRQDTQAMVLGGHGDDMVPLPRFSSAGGIPLTTWIDMGILKKDRLDAIIERTRKGGGEIVQLLGTGSAFYAPAVSAMNMAECYLFDTKRMLPCCVLLEGEYGVNGLFVGVPVVIGKNGIERIVELELNEQEKTQFGRSIESVKKTCEEVKRLL